MAKRGTFKEELEKLLQVAMSDTGQSSRVASFLLSWWNAGTCGGWDMTDFWGLDRELVESMFVVMSAVAVNQFYPDNIGYSDHFKALIEKWRPHLLEGSQ